MANEEHLEILRRGVEEWNAWRREHWLVIEPDLTGADLAGADLVGAIFDFARLVNANLADANLDRANFSGAYLRSATFEGSSLVGVNFVGATAKAARFLGTSLVRTHFDGALLDHANFIDTNLDGVTFNRASLVGATFDHASLKDTVFDAAKLDRTSFDRAGFVGGRFEETAILNVNLSAIEGLDTVDHRGPSNISTSTLERTAAGLVKDHSRREAIEKFYRGCGLSDWEIGAARLYSPNLTREQVTNILYEIDRIRADSPILVNPLFISYSHSNAPFVEALEERFDENRIRYWRDVHDLKAGRLETQIDRAIRHNPIVLLVLSEASVESDWVEWEVSKAREFEKTEKRDVLCPVALDDAWKTCSWPGPLRRQIEDYNILDFSEWQDDAAMERQLKKLIDGLGMFYPNTGQ